MIYKDNQNTTQSGTYLHFVDLLSQYSKFVVDGLLTDGNHLQLTPMSRLEYDLERIIIGLPPLKVSFM